MANALASQYPDLRILYADDSAMLFDTASPPDRVATLAFAKNVFRVISSIDRGGLDASVMRLSREVGGVPFPRPTERGNGFRLMFHIDGSLASAAPRGKTALEHAIAVRTNQYVERRGSCQEYWVIGRTELPELLLAARLPRPRRVPGKRGALSHELSAILVAAAGPTPRDIFLDPFGGSGSLVLARLELPVRKVWYSDTDLATYRPGFDRKLVGNDRVRLLDEDALDLPSIADGSIDVIVTDPPWGEYEELSLPYGEFAEGVATSFSRVLHPARGRYALLVNRGNAPVLSQALDAAGLAPDDAHEILVNGHPATAFVRKGPQGATVMPARTGKPVHGGSRTSARTAR